MANCLNPNCGKELKKGSFSSNLPYKKEAVEFIHTFTLNTSPGYCNSCGKPGMDKGRENATARDKELSATLNKHIKSLPILSLQAPAGWKYTPLGLVTGQSVTGTGVFSEFASSWTDLLGAQSKTYNKKIAGGEAICQTQLRIKCVEMGGNAILATDIDYAEVGGGKGMLMVCMTGTAVLLENIEVLGPDAIDGLEILTQTAAKSREVRRFDHIIDSPIMYIPLTEEGV